MAPPPPVHTVFSCVDLTAAVAASDAFLRDVYGAARSEPMRETCRTLAPDRDGPEGSAPLTVSYRHNNLLTAEFAITSAFNGFNGEADAIERIVAETASTRNVYAEAAGGCALHAVRFVLPDVAPRALSLLVHRLANRFGNAILVVVAATPAARLDARARSGFATVRVPPTPGFALPPAPAALEALVADVVDACVPELRKGRTGRAFELAHAASFKLCGSMVPVGTLCRALVAHAARRLKKDDDDEERYAERMRGVLRALAGVDALTGALAGKASLLFDRALLEVAGVFAD